MRRFIVLCIVVSAFFGGRVVSAADVPLTLAQARQRAIKQNLDILVAKMERQVQSQLGRRARRPFVPVLSFDLTYDDDAPLVSVAPRTRRFRYGAGVQWLLRSGTQLAVSAQGVEVLAGQAPQIVPGALLSLSAVQPLWQGGWGLGNTVDAADMEVRRQRMIFIGQLNRLLVDVDRAYWSLVLAQADVTIKTRSMQRAQTQYDETAENIKRGLLAPAEIYLVEENLNLFKQNLLRSKESLRLAQLSLGRVLQEKPEVALVATQKLVAPDDVMLLRYQSPSRQVLGRHPQVAIAQMDMEQARIQARFERNQIAPRLDLVGQVDLNGRGRDAWVQAFKASLPDYSLGLVFQMPLVRDPDFARVEQATLRLKQSRLRIKRAMQEVAFDLKEVVTQCKARRNILKLANKRVRLARLKLQTERDKYKRGYSSLDRIVRFQRDVDNAFISQQRLLVDLLVLNSRLAERAGQLHVELNVKVR